jgi:hypothetical protein
MPIDQAHTVVSRTGAVIFDLDPLLGPKDSMSRVMDGLESITIQLLAASPTAGHLWTAHEGIWRLGTASEIHAVVGGAAAALQLYVTPSGTAPGSGTAQLTGTIDLTATANAVRFGTLIATPTQLLRGDSLCYVLTGTITGLVGSLTVNMWRVG